MDEFGSDSSFQQGLMQFFQALVEVALPILANEAGLVEHPDTVDDLFRLCSRLVFKAFKIFLNEVLQVFTTMPWALP